MADSYGSLRWKRSYGYFRGNMDNFVNEGIDIYLNKYDNKISVYYDGLYIASMTPDDVLHIATPYVLIPALPAYVTEFHNWFGLGISRIQFGFYTLYTSRQYKDGVCDYMYYPDIYCNTQTGDFLSLMYPIKERSCTNKLRLPDVYTKMTADFKAYKNKLTLLDRVNPKQFISAYSGPFQRLVAITQLDKDLHKLVSHIKQGHVDREFIVDLALLTGYVTHAGGSWSLSSTVDRLSYVVRQYEHYMHILYGLYGEPKKWTRPLVRE